MQDSRKQVKSYLDTDRVQPTRTLDNIRKYFGRLQEQQHPRNWSHIDTKLQKHISTGSQLKNKKLKLPPQSSLNSTTLNQNFPPQEVGMNNYSSTNIISGIQTGRPTTRGSAMTFATTRAAGRVSTGMVAGRSNDSEVTCNLDTSMILTPQPNLSMDHKRLNSSSLTTQNNKQSSFRFPTQAPKLYNGNNNFQNKSLASHNDRRSMLQLSSNNNNNNSNHNSLQKLTDFKSVRYSVASPNNEQIPSASTTTNQNMVKINAFTQNLQQKVRYMLIRQQQKYKKTDTLNLKSKNNNTFDIVSQAVKNRGNFNSNTGTSSLWDSNVQPKQYSPVTKSSINDYNFITNERKQRSQNNNNSFQNIFGQTQTSSFRRQKGFSNFIHNARNTSVNMNPEYQRKMNYYSNTGNNSQRNATTLDSPFKRSGGMCAKMLDISHLNTFLPKPFKR